MTKATNCQACGGPANYEDGTFSNYVRGYEPVEGSLLCWPCCRDVTAYARSFGEPVSARYNIWLAMVRASVEAPA